MIYEEFTERLGKLGVAELPTMDEYTDIIEPVYNYHPVLNTSLAKDACAEMYSRYGIGIFKVLLPEVARFAEMEQRLLALRHQYEEAKAEFDRLNEQYIRTCQEIRKEWRCVG